jgi:hypothetical protein
MNHGFDTAKKKTYYKEALEALQEAIAIVGHNEGRSTVAWNPPHLLCPGIRIMGS